MLCFLMVRNLFSVGIYINARLIMPSFIMLYCCSFFTRVLFGIGFVMFLFCGIS